MTTCPGCHELETSSKRIGSNLDFLLSQDADIPRLRKLIVALALRGRVVHQDAREGNDKARLALTDEVTDEPGLEGLPVSWRWVPLGILISAGPKNGYSPKAVERETGVKSLTLTATTSGRFDSRFFKYIDEVIPPDSELWLRDGDLLVQRGNTIDYVGVAAVYRGPPTTFIYPDLMMKIRVTSEVDLDYVHMAVNGPAARKFVGARASGTSGSMPKINQATVRGIPVPLPPLAEQKRIVAKVDQLIALCDALEARQTKKRETSNRLIKSALQALTNAEGSGEFEVAWKRVVENFDVLVDRAEKVGEVRSAILELAVRGRLVEQRASDGVAPAFVMSDEAPFPLPSGWRWGRVESLASDIVDCLHATPRYTGSGYPAIRTADVVPGRMLLDQARLLDEAQYRERIRRLEPRAGDIFYSREGERLGIAACVPPGATVCLSQRMMHIRIREPLDPVYMMWVMNSRGVYAQAVGDIGGSTSPHVNMKDIRRFLVPVPPPAEQRRILIVLERFMKICDELEARLRRSEERAAKFVEAVVRDLVA